MALTVVKAYLKNPNIGVWCLVLLEAEISGVFDNFPKGDPPKLGSWTEGNIELQSSLEEPFCNCRMTHIIQN